MEHLTLDQTAIYEHDELNGAERGDFALTDFGPVATGFGEAEQPSICSWKYAGMLTEQQ